MKQTVNIIALLVGALFIFSGLIKLNDPIGTEIKLEEYFDVFSEDFRDKIVVNGQVKSSQDNTTSNFFQMLKPFSLSLAVLMSALEVIWGFSLLVRFRPKYTLIMLFLLVLFFTGLTFYSWYYNKVTDCGCFGDAIKLRPVESFIKDMVLTVLIAFLLFKNKYLVPNQARWAGASSLLVSLASLGIGLYAIYYLPFIDFMPYKVGNNIPSLMKPKEPLKYENQYIYTNLQSKEDETYTEKQFGELWETKLGDSTKYKYKAFKQTLLNPEAQAKIGADFVWADGDTTTTKQMFKGNKLLIIVADDRKTNIKSFTEISMLLKSLKNSQIETLGLSSNKSNFEIICHEYQMPTEHHSMDSKILKAMIRANPGIMLLKNGTVKGKWHYNRLPTAEMVKKLINE